MHFELYAPVLEVHPFFHNYIKEYPQIVSQVCHNAMTTLLVSNGDVVFTAGEIPRRSCMYIVCDGSFQYYATSMSVISVEMGQWMAEATLWVQWTHRGVLKGTADGRLCMLYSDTFYDVVSHFDHADFTPKKYAVKYTELLNMLIEENLELTDLPHSYEADCAEASGFLMKESRTSAERRSEGLRVFRRKTVLVKHQRTAGIKAPRPSFVKVFSPCGSRQVTDFPDEPLARMRSQISMRSGSCLQVVEDAASKSVSAERTSQLETTEGFEQAERGVQPSRSSPCLLGVSAQAVQRAQLKDVRLQ